jgi:hypothetical protein
MSLDAGALLLGKADRAIRLVTRFAACFIDARASELIDHSLETLVGQRLFGLAFGYEDLNDHDHLRHDPDGRARGQARGAPQELRAGCRQVDAQPARASVRGEGTCLRK